MLLIKNIESELFYVSDHGHFEELLKYAQAAVFQLKWLEEPQSIAQLKQALDILSKLPPDEREKFRSDFNQMNGNNWDIDTIKRVFSYFHNIIFPRLNKLFASSSSPHNQYIFSRFKNDIDAANQMVRRLRLLDIAQDINKGTYESLFRPVRAYSTVEKGDTYPAFEKAVDDYFSLGQHLNAKEVAAKMRKILVGETLLSDELLFLANLTGAWFVAESVRNSLSILTGIMLIDMIENGITLIDKDGNDWYSWINTLIHPLKRKNEENVKDLYGSKIGIDRFGGSHPMAHGGSVNDAAKPLTLKVKLTTVRQKEGSLIAHWLYEYINISDKKLFVQVKLIKAEDEKPVLQPEYDEIADIDNDSEKLAATSKKIKKLEGTVRAKKKESINADVKKEEVTINELKSQKNKLEKKQFLQKEIIEPLLRKRLSTLENLFSFANTRDDLKEELLKSFEKSAPVSVAPVTAFYKKPPTLEEKEQAERLVTYYCALNKIS